MGVTLSSCASVNCSETNESFGVGIVIGVIADCDP